MNIDRSDTPWGLYNKFTVMRNDGRSAPGEKHQLCWYFVLDADHDPHAKAALKAYAESCRQDFPLLASDLDALIKTAPFGGTPEPVGLEPLAQETGGRG